MCCGRLQLENGKECRSLIVFVVFTEYAYTLKVGEKGDIYSFGVVLLELVTGKQPVDPSFGEGIDLVKWVNKKVQSKEGIHEVLDQRVGLLPREDMVLLLRVGILCTSVSPMQRPSMREVVKLLKEASPETKEGSKSEKEGQGLVNRKDEKRDYVPLAFVESL